jgi:hypothetical protein
MGSVSRPIPPASPNHLSALSGSTPPQQGSAHPANASWPPSTSPFEPRDAAGTLRRALPSPSSIAPHLSPPRQRTTSHNLPPLHPEPKTTNSAYEWPFVRDSRELGQPSSSSSFNLQSSRMQSTRDPQQQLYNMLPNALAGPSSGPASFLPPEPSYGGTASGGGNMDFQWMTNPHAYPPSAFPGYNTNPMSGDPNSRADSETRAQVGAVEYTKVRPFSALLTLGPLHLPPSARCDPSPTSCKRAGSARHRPELPLTIGDCPHRVGHTGGQGAKADSHAPAHAIPRAARAPVPRWQAPAHRHVLPWMRCDRDARMASWTSRSSHAVQRLRELNDCRQC